MEIFLVAAVAMALLGGLALGFRIGRKPYQEQLHKLESAHQSVLAQTVTLERDLATTQAERANLATRIQEMEDHASNAQQLLQNQFENLAHKIFESKTSTFRKESEEAMVKILSPLRERLTDFQKKVEDTYQAESRERFSLKNEIQKIVEANHRITTEAQNLTHALRGDVKAQGTWGEIILEKILESSGLREGTEYTTQGRNLQLENSEGKRQQPDVIIHLPDDKHLILDAKVVLVSYERFVACDGSDEKRPGHLKAFLESIYRHIDSLSGKKYPMSDKLLSPEFVMMFFPIEGAFALAMQSDPELFGYAWNKSLVLVSPTTLLATLRTVESIWKRERQNQNALKIAAECGKLYDKFVGFTEDLERVGEQLHRADDAFEAAWNKLKTGKGNLIQRAENIRELGAKTAKKISSKLLDDEDVAPRAAPLSPNTFLSE